MLTETQSAQFEKLISTKLAVCDICNKQTEGKERYKMGEDELRGVKIALYVMGYELILNMNPYFHENSERSTFEIKELPNYECESILQESDKNPEGKFYDGDGNAY